MAQPSEQQDAAATGAPRWRRILSTSLIVLGCVLAPLSVHAVWLHNTLVNTDQYVATVGPLASNADVQNALANRITNTLVSSSTVETKLKEALPPAASFAVPFVAKGLNTFVHDAALRVLQSSKFEQLWKSLNRRVHSRLVALLRGQGRFVNSKGQVAVDIQPIINRVNSALEKVGVTGLSKAARQSSHEIVIISSSGLRSAQGAVRVFDDLAIVLPILAVVAFAAGIVAAADRRRKLVRGAVALSLVMLFFIVVWKALRSPYTDALPPSVNQPAARAVYDQLISFLLLALWTVFALSVVVALGGWLAGPGELATRIRTKVRDALSRTPGEQLVPARVAQLAKARKNAIRAAIIGLGLLILVLLNHPGPLAVVLIAVLVLALLGGLEIVVRGAPVDQGARGS